MNDRCPGTNRNDEQCGHPAGWGVDGKTEGPCKFHGGATPTKEENPNVGKGSEDQDGNTRAVTHGLYAQVNSFYQDVLNDDMRELCDDIFDDYYEQYSEIHGEPGVAHTSRLFEIAVNHLKIVHADNWSVDKPDALESGSPIVDKETRKKQISYPDGSSRVVDEYRYKENVTIATQQKLRREDRAWLKDMGLLDDPESQKADAIDNAADAWRNFLNS